MCDQELTLQIDNAFYQKFTAPRISKAPGPNGKTASFDITLQTNEPPPIEEKLVCIMNGNSKLFGGLIASAPFEVVNNELLFHCSCIDFTKFTRKQKIILYDSITQANAKSHVTRMLPLADAGFDETLGTNLLGVKVINPFPFPPIPLGQPDPRLFKVVVQDQTLEEALNQFFPDYMWHVDMGDWADISKIKPFQTPVIANIVLTHRDVDNGVAPINRIDIDGLVDDCGTNNEQWKNFKANFQSTQVTRIIVANSEETLKIAKGIEPVERQFFQGFDANADVDRFKLRATTTRLLNAKLSY